MKRMIKLTAFCAAAFMAAALAQAQSDVKPRTERSGSASLEGKTTFDKNTANQAGNQYRGSKLLGTKVRSGQGDDIGELEDLVLDPKTGEIQFAVLGLGGVLGIGEKKAPVPWKALNVSAENQVTINVDKSKLETGPRLTKDDWNNLHNRDFMQKVYSHYGMQMPTGTGATGASVDIEVGSEQGKNKSDKSLKFEGKAKDKDKQE